MSIDNENDLDDDINLDELDEETPEEEDEAPAEEEGDEPDEDADGDDEGEEEDEQPAKKNTRGARRISKLEKERDEDRRRFESTVQENQRLQRLLEDATRLVNGGGNNDAQREAEKLALMEPHERTAYQSQKMQEQFNKQLNTLQFQIADSNDRSVFQAKAASNPVYAKYANDVETELAKMHKTGMTAPREDILAYVIGKKALAKSGSPANAKRKSDATARVNAARGKSTSARSDGATVRSNKGKSAEQRLEGVII